MNTIGMLGKWPHTHDPSVLKITNYLNQGISALNVPDTLNLADRVTEPFPMDGNDTLGDCVIEGTMVSGPRGYKGYKGYYSGPVVRLTFASGKILTITPNHSVLTSTGFRVAKFLHKGDYVVGANFGGPLHVIGGYDFEQVETSIEKVVATLGLIGRSIHPMTNPNDFNGDGRFMNGNVHIVGANGLLEREHNPPSSQVNGKEEFWDRYKPEVGLHRDSTFFKGNNTGRPTACSSIGSTRNGSALILTRTSESKTSGLRNGPRNYTVFAQNGHESSSAHTILRRERARSFPGLVSGDGLREVRHSHSVVHRRRLANGSDLCASLNHPAPDGSATDPELPGHLIKRLPGIVEMDSIVNVERDTYAGHVYDLQTETSWYVANGIITHNCTCAAAAHMIQVWSALVGQEVIPDPATVEKMYFNITKGVDSGAVELDVLNYWKANPLNDWAPGAFVACDPNDDNHIKAAANLFGGVYIGIQLPIAAQTQDVWDAVAGPDGQPGGWGGHAVNVVGYDKEGLTVVTWGKLKRMTWAFWAAYCDEAWAVLPNEWEKAPGLNWKALEADLAEVKN